MIAIMIAVMMIMMMMIIIMIMIIIIFFITLNCNSVIFNNPNPVIILAKEPEYIFCDQNKKGSWSYN